MIGVRVFSVLLMLLAAACAENTQWQNASVPQEQWNMDRADCQSRAQQQAESELAINQQSNRSLNYDRGGQWSGQMNRFSAQQRQQQLFESCMQQKGYQQVPVSPPES